MFHKKDSDLSNKRQHTDLILAAAHMVMVENIAGGAIADAVREIRARHTQGISLSSDDLTRAMDMAHHGDMEAADGNTAHARTDYETSVKILESYLQKNH